MSILFAANSWFCIITDLSYGVKASKRVRVTALPELLTPEHLFSKYFYSIEGIPLWYLLYFGFLATLNALSRNTLSESALLGKSWKSPYAISFVESKLYLVRFGEYILNLLLL